MNTYKLREALEELVQQRSVLDEAITSLRKTIAIMNGGDGTGTPAQTDSSDRSYIDDAVKILRSAGEPIHIDELVRKISELRGEPIERPPIESSLSRHITKTKNPRVVRTKPGFYGLPGREVSAFGNKGVVDE